MKPGDRVNLIRQLAEVLVNEEYTHIDLMLRQFGVPWQANWNGDKYDYLLTMLEAGEDADLLALYEHAGGAPVRSTRPDFWNSAPICIFISHISANKSFAAALKVALGRYGIGGFVAHEDIEPTRQWVEEIEAALSTCDALVAVLSPGFKESNWTDQEVGYCHGRRIPIISVRQGIDPYGFISRYQALNGHGKTPDQVASEIYRILVRHSKTADRMADALVMQFEQSDSYAAAKFSVVLLSDIVKWTPDLLRRVEQAYCHNSQIREAWGVRAQVAALLQANGVDNSLSPATGPSDSYSEDDLPF